MIRRPPRSTRVPYTTLFRSHKIQSGTVTRRAGHTGHRRVIHRRALVTDHKARKGAGAVAALARRAADRDMVAPRELEHPGRHVGKAPSRAVALRAIRLEEHTSE